MNEPASASQITAVICAHNPPDVIRIIVERLCRCGFRTVVIDDGSRSPLQLGMFHDNLQLVRSNENIGLAAARNLALEQVSTPWVLFVDADVLPAHEFLQRLPDVLSTSPADGVGFHVREHYRRSDWDFYRATERDRVTTAGAVEWISGLLCAYRTEALRAIGGFDPARRTNGEDVDLGRRLSRQGGRLVQLPEVYGEHHRKDTLSSFLRMHYRYAVTAKLVDRTQYSAADRGKPPLFYWTSIAPQLRLFAAFLRCRPWAIYLPPLVLMAMMLGAAAGRRVLKRGGPRPLATVPRTKLATE